MFNDMYVNDCCCWIRRLIRAVVAIRSVASFDTTVTAVPLPYVALDSCGSMLRSYRLFVCFISMKKQTRKDIPFESDRIPRSIIVLVNKRTNRGKEKVLVQVIKKKWRGIVTADGQDVAVAFVFVFVFIVVIIVLSYYY